MQRSVGAWSTSSHPRGGSMESSTGGGGWNDVMEQPAASSSIRRDGAPPTLGLPPRPHRRGNSFDRAQQEANNDFHTADPNLWTPPTPASSWHREDPSSLQPVSPLSALRNSSTTRPYHSDDADPPQLRTSLSSIPYVSSPVAQQTTPLAVSFIDHDTRGGVPRRSGDPNGQRFGVSHSRTSTGGGEYPQSPGGRSNLGVSAPSAFSPLGGGSATNDRSAFVTSRTSTGGGEYPQSPGGRSNRGASAPSAFSPLGGGSANDRSAFMTNGQPRMSTVGGEYPHSPGQRSNHGDDAPDAFPPADAPPLYSNANPSQPMPLRSLDATTLSSMPSMNLMRPKSSASLLSRSTRTHWEVPQPALAEASSTSPAAQPQADQQSQEVAQLRKVMRDKSEEIMRLRASLIIALQCYSYAPSGGGDVSHAERQFLSAVGNAVAADADTDAPVLLVDQAPSHVQGVPTMPLPLDINSIFGQFYGFLQMLETEEKTIFKKSWKPRFVVADQHGIAVFREENDFKLHAFHKAIIYVPYHDLEFFVPSFRDATIPEMLQRATESEDASVAALTQMTLVAQHHAADTRNAYFGFISKQTPHSSQKNSNPQIVFRSSSFQEHADWVHFLAKCFNMRLYRDMFPMMLAETMFGLICKESQTEPGPTEHLETQTDDVVIQEEDAALMFSPPPPPPPGDAPTDGCTLTADDAGDGVAEGIDFTEAVARFQDAETGTNIVAIRAEACQTDDLPQWVSSVATASSEVLDSESAILQRHMHALEEQCKQLRQENDALKQERDEAVDYAATVQASLAVAERETKRLRQMVIDEHQSALDMIADAQREDLEEAKAKQDKVFEIEQANSELQKKVLALNAEIDQLNEALVASRRESVEHIQALAKKAVSDIDTLHSEMLKADMQSSTIFSPPRTMLLEGCTNPPEEEEIHGSELQRRLGTLDLFCNGSGDVQFNLVLNHRLCHIASTHEVREQLRKTWRLRSSLTDGEVEVSASLRWDDDDGDDDDDNVSVGSDQSSIGLPAEDVVTPRNARKTSANARNVKDESTQGMLDRLHRVTPASLVGRVALQKKPFVPYV